MRIEEGKFYLNRKGDCVGPMTRAMNAGIYYWHDQFDRPYFWNGRAQVGANEHPNDLVKEWMNPEAPPFNKDAAQQQHVPAPPPIPPKNSFADPNYAALVTVLKAAHEQAAFGKGRERHANERGFDRQPIMELGRMFGPGFSAGQAAKKAQEAMGMIQRGDAGAAEAELLGAINYLAACVMLVREQAAAA